VSMTCGFILKIAWPCSSPNWVLCPIQSGRKNPNNHSPAQPLTMFFNKKRGVAILQTEYGRIHLPLFLISRQQCYLDINGFYYVSPFTSVKECCSFCRFTMFVVNYCQVQKACSPVSLSAVHAGIVRAAFDLRLQLNQAKMCHGCVSTKAGTQLPWPSVQINRR
jgi:hypothetical protein